MSYSILDNRKMYTSTSLEYEKNVHSITSIEEDNIKEQQDYSYGNPLQDNIYLSRYNSFLTGIRDADILPTPYTEIKLEKKEKKEDLCKMNEDFCTMNEDGVTNACGTDKKLSKILDPRFNLREAAKNLILLEVGFVKTNSFLSKPSKYF